ncbi:MAG: hypothetical protein ACJ76D_08995 [Solirubrobacterales bacterium]
MNEYSPRALSFMDNLAEEIWLYPDLRIHNGADGLERFGRPATKPPSSAAATT